MSLDTGHAATLIANKRKFSEMNDDQPLKSTKMQTSATNGSASVSPITQDETVNSSVNIQKQYLTQLATLIAAKVAQDQADAFRNQACDDYEVVKRKCSAYPALIDTKAKRYHDAHQRARDCGSTFDALLEGFGSYPPTGHDQASARLQTENAQLHQQIKQQNKMLTDMMSTLEQLTARTARIENDSRAAQQEAQLARRELAVNKTGIDDRVDKAAKVYSSGMETVTQKLDTQIQDMKGFKSWQETVDTRISALPLRKEFDVLSWKVRAIEERALNSQELEKSVSSVRAEQTIHKDRLVALEAKGQNMQPRAQIEGMAHNELQKLIARVDALERVPNTTTASNCSSCKEEIDRAFGTLESEVSDQFNNVDGRLERISEEIVESKQSDAVDAITLALEVSLAAAPQLWAGRIARERSMITDNTSSLEARLSRYAANLDAAISDLLDRTDMRLEQVNRTTDPRMIHAGPARVASGVSPVNNGVNFFSPHAPVQQQALHMLPGSPVNGANGLVSKQDFANFWSSVDNRFKGIDMTLHRMCKHADMQMLATDFKARIERISQACDIRFKNTSASLDGVKSLVNSLQDMQKQRDSDAIVPKLELRIANTEQFLRAIDNRADAASTDIQDLQNAVQGQEDSILALLDKLKTFIESDVPRADGTNHEVEKGGDASSGHAMEADLEVFREKLAWMQTMCLDAACYSALFQGAIQELQVKCDVQPCDWDKAFQNVKQTMPSV